MLAPQISMRERMAMYNANALKIGLFGPNCSSGRAVTRVPERWSGSWPDNLRLARMADEAGIDFLLPIARYRMTLPPAAILFDFGNSYRCAFGWQSINTRAIQKPTPMR